MRQAHPVRHAHAARHAHRRDGGRRRIATVGVALAIGATAILAISAIASGGSATRARADALATPIAGVAERADRSGLAPASVGSSPATLATIDDRAARAGVEKRPRVVVPDVAPRAVPRMPAAGSRVVVLGDSYTTGSNGAGFGSRNWTTIVGRTRGWTMLNLAVAGTGFLNRGWTNQPVGSLVSAAIRQRPDMIVLASGHNDSRWTAATTSAEADRVIDRLHARLPDVVIVIVAPIWQNGTPPTRCLALRDHLRRKAAAVGALFIDPLAERWFAGANHRFIGTDGLHPTNLGHRHIADVVLEDLADLLAT